MSYIEDPSTNGFGSIHWDGNDGVANLLELDGLGSPGVDLTEGGTHNAFRVRLLATSTFSASFGISVWNQDFFQSSSPTTLVNGISMSTDVIIPFSTFGLGSGDTPPDFTDIGAISIGVSPPATPGALLEFDLIDTVFLIPGDFDLDGDVDGFDFLEWQRGESPDPLSASDLSDWEANFGSAIPLSAASTAVPEPSTCWMLLFGMVATLIRHQVLVS